MPSAEPSAEPSADVTARRVFGLALPALGVLAVEPLYLLFDAAVVGRLGALPLAGLAVGGLIVAQVSTQLTFLSYGTTARSARLNGAGRRQEAIGEGAAATFIAVGLGVAIVVIVQCLAQPVVSLIGGGGAIADEALTWLRIASFGIPCVLVGLAGNGWMRGIEDTARPLRIVVTGLAVSTVLSPCLVYGLIGMPRMELAGSAVANVAGQGVAAVLFVLVLLRSGASTRPRVQVMRAQLVLGRDLVLRSVAFQACFLSVAAVAARFGASALAANQVVLQLWNLVALTLDSIAIAAQTLIGGALGAGDKKGAQRLVWRLTGWSTIFAMVLALVFAAGRPIIPGLFTDDVTVVENMYTVWWMFVAIIPCAGVVFALDGVLLGSGDAAFLRNATIACALVGFLPFIWASLLWDWGLRGIWLGLILFVLLRMGAVVGRVLSGRWAVVGADRQLTADNNVERP